MNNIERIVYGLVITVLIFLIATIVSIKLDLGIDFMPSSFLTHTIMLVLSIVGIFTLRKNLSYSISIPKFKTLIKPIVYGIVITIVVNFLLAIIIKIAGGKIEAHPILSKMNPLQILIFVFIYASIAEELLFRGFLMNLLKPLGVYGIFLFKRKLSLPVMISAVAFGAAHLIIITTGVSLIFLLKLVTFTICIGLLAGYYQEKHDNNLHAIIVHMAGNSLAVISAFLMN